MPWLHFFSTVAQMQIYKKIWSELKHASATLFSLIFRLYSGGNTPLHCAAMDGHIELVKLLLRRGARAETQDFKYKKSFFLTLPLHFNKSDRLFSFLSSGLTPLDHALDAGHNSLELLLRITMEKKKPILLSSPSRTVKKKTIVKASLKSRPASVSFNKNHVAEVAKIARPTRVAAKKRQ